MILTLLGSVFFALCIFAALHDIHSLKIPNWLNLTLAGLFIPAAAVSGLPLEMLGGHLLVGLAAFLVAFGLFAFNIFGGGDAKMIPAVMLWVGPSAWIEFVIGMALAGGLLALLILVVRKTVPAVLVPGAIRASFEDKAGVPYGVAITAGVFAAGTASPLLSQVLRQFGIFG